MTRAFLSLLLLLPIAAISQAVKPDFVRTPNGPNTIVDWNVKFKTLILPHFNKSNVPLYQGRDTIGGVFVNTDTTDRHLYVKQNNGVYTQIANVSDIAASVIPPIYVKINAGTALPYTIPMASTYGLYGAKPSLTTQVASGSTLLTFNDFTVNYVYSSLAYSTLNSIVVYGHDDGTGHFDSDTYVTIKP